MGPLLASWTIEVSILLGLLSAVFFGKEVTPESLGVKLLLSNNILFPMWFFENLIRSPDAMQN
ncbi:MAG TPA: hypothetical protein DD706_18665 [Nitrospiraceae bacterium]|nr:hypothetical protein [Nitrospiraceae bacterium]